MKCRTERSNNAKIIAFRCVCELLQKNITKSVIIDKAGIVFVYSFVYMNVQAFFRLPVSKILCDVSVGRQKTRAIHAIAHQSSLISHHPSPISNTYAFAMHFCSLLEYCLRPQS